jgi:hypothetical protein
MHFFSFLQFFLYDKQTNVAAVQIFEHGLTFGETKVTGLSEFLPFEAIAFIG